MENKDVCFICSRTVAHPPSPKRRAAPGTEASRAPGGIGRGPGVCGLWSHHWSLLRSSESLPGQDPGLLNPAKENRSQFITAVSLGNPVPPPSLASAGAPALGMPHECDCFMDKVLPHPRWSLRPGAVPLSSSPRPRPHPRPGAWKGPRRGPQEARGGSPAPAAHHTASDTHSLTAGGLPSRTPALPGAF